jgi:hypothetical protein
MSRFTFGDYLAITHPNNFVTKPKGPLPELSDVRAD